MVNGTSQRTVMPTSGGIAKPSTHAIVSRAWPAGSYSVPEYGKEFPGADLEQGRADHRRCQDRRPGGRQPVEVIYCRDWATVSDYHIIEAAENYLDIYCIQDCFNRPEAPVGDQDGQNNKRRPGFNYCARLCRLALIVAGGSS